MGLRLASRRLPDHVSGWKIITLSQDTISPHAAALARDSARGARGAVRSPKAALVVTALAQLMIALDATVMNIALPSAQAALGLSTANRQWVITAYTLAFGGLVLLGGRIADQIGHKTAFLIGLAGFGAASAVGGAAVSPSMLIGARAVQGVFAALLAPTALSLLAMTYAQPRERAKAFAVYGAIAGSGAAVGLILGGALTQYLSWRWCLYLTVPVAVITLAAARVALPGAGTSGRQRLDVPGALLASAGLVALVYACAQAVSVGWASAQVVGPLMAIIVLAALFVVRESRVAHPLLPLRILTDRNRAGAYTTLALSVAGLLGLYLFLTYYLQVVLGYSPLTAGLAFLPLSGAVLLSAYTIAAPLLPRVAPRRLVVLGLLVAAAGMTVLTRIGIDSGYATHVLPGLVLVGLGMGCVFTPAISTAMARIEPRDAGIASAVVNTAQQIGASVGVAVLNTVAAGTTASYLISHPLGRQVHTTALAHGYTTAALYAAGILTGAAVLAAVFLNAQALPARPTTPARTT